MLVADGGVHTSLGDVQAEACMWWCTAAVAVAEAVGAVAETMGRRSSDSVGARDALCERPQVSAAVLSKQ